MDLINCGLSFSIIWLYIFFNNLPEQTTDNKWYPNLLFAIHIYFAIEYLLKLYTAKNIQNFLLSIDNFIELATLLPFFTVTLSI